MEKAKKTVQSFGLWQSKSYVFCPENYSEVKQCIDFARENNLNVALKGGAMSFSSVCLAKENAVLIDLSKLNKILAKNDDSILVQAGARIFDILKLLLVGNKIIGALSGSIHNTVGGNIGSDINGKDSWHIGNFGSNLLSMKVMTANGEIVLASKTQNEDLFFSVIAGLGTVGIVLEVELIIHHIPSTTVYVQEQKVSDIDQLMEVLLNADSRSCQFLYAWLNPHATGNKLGQGIVYKANFTTGKPTTITEIERYERKLDKQRIFGIKKPLFWKLMQIFYTRKIHMWASYAKYLLQKDKKHQEVSFFDFQYPMVKYLPDWNLYFFPYGFTELHIFFPFTQFKKCFVEIMDICRDFHLEPFTLAVRRHKNSEGFLSFSGDGLSFTINYSREKSCRNKNSIFEQKIKEYCNSNKGKIYLSKYPYFSNIELSSMYQDFAKFVSTRKKYDPKGLFKSHGFMNNN